MIRPNLYDYIKVLALLTMIIDHVGYFIFPDIIWLRVIGRIAFPLFLLLVGYNASYRSKKRLWITAIVLQSVIVLLYRQGIIPEATGNILLAIVLTRLILSWITKQSLTIQTIIFTLSLALVPLSYPWIDYGTISLSFALLGWRMRQFRSRWIMVGRASLIMMHIIFMIIIRHFPPSTYRALAGVGILLFFTGRWLYRENAPLRLTPMSDTIILWLSKNALTIYIIHGILLISIALLREYINNLVK